ncbi:MAG: hypothetical protein Q9167_007571 [Letrouitia subvulpina]
MPGAGKTIMASIVADHLCTKYQHDSSIGIVYLFCNFRREEEQKPIDLLANLLKQLIQGLTYIPQSVKTLYEQHEIIKIFIVIDALDECRLAAGDRQQFLLELFKLQVGNKGSLFATSRFIPEVTKHFADNSVSIEICATNQDVERYLDGHMSQLPSFVKSSPDSQNEIKTKIVKAVSGMFLLAQLHLDSLVGKRSRKAIRSALEKLASGSEAYDNAYEDAMKRVEGQIKDKEELAKQILMWITCARRPLETLELQHALAVEVGNSELDEDNFPQVEDMVSVCAGLVTVDEESGIIRLVHYTTQKYFERTQTLWFSNANSDITKIYVTYLMFNVFASGYFEDYRHSENYWHRNSPYALYKYAVTYWGQHARLVSTLLPEVMKLLDSRLYINASAQEIDNFERNHLNDRINRLHLAAYFGLENAVRHLLKTEAKIDFLNFHVWSPLSLAAAGGHEAVAKLLIKEGFDIDHKDWYGRSPPMYAASKGHTDIFNLLIDAGAKPDSKDKSGQTSLWFATKGGHNALVGHILNNFSININARNTWGTTPLLQALKDGHEAIAVRLLDRGADPNVEDIDGETALIQASRTNPIATVKRLLKRGADTERRDQYGWTPLMHASWNRRSDIVRILFTNNANPNACDNLGRTAFFYAVLDGSTEIIETLIADDRVERDSKDYYGMAPLALAVICRRQEVVELLLATSSVNPDSQDNSGRTPLWWTRWERIYDAERLLLDYAKKKSIVMSNPNLPVMDCTAPTERSSTVFCSVCTLGLMGNRTYYICSACTDFLWYYRAIIICSECKAFAVRCLDNLHVLNNIHMSRN